MSSKYKMLMLSTSLTAALCFATLTPANAGFEWTPPEKQEIPQPVAMPKVEEVPASSLIDENDLPPIEIKVIEDEIASPIEETIIKPEITPQDKIEEIIIQDQPIDMMMPIEENTAEIQVTEEDIVEIQQQEVEIEELIEKNASDNISISPVDMPYKESKSEIADNVEVVEEPKNNEDHFDLELFPDDVIEKSETIILTADSEEMITIETASSAEVKDMTSKEEIMWNAPENFDVVEGFGSDMPLALALRQIVPARYAFSFGSGVNPGSRISWEGGKPWNEVLQDALAYPGYSFDVVNQKVLLKKVETIDLEPQKKSNDEPILLEESNSSEILEILTVDDSAEIEAVREKKTENIDSVLDSVIQDEIEDVESKIDLENNASFHEQEMDVLSPTKSIVQITEANIPDDMDIEIIEIDQTGKPTPTQSFEDKSEDIIDSQPMKPVSLTENELAEVLKPSEEGVNETQQNKTSEVLEITSKEKLDSEIPAEKQTDDIIDAVLMAEEEIEETSFTESEQKKIIEIPTLDDSQIENQSALTVISQSDVQETVEEMAPISLEDVTEVMSVEPEDLYRTEPSNEVKLWSAKSGQNLKKVVQEWSEQENLNLVWDAPDNYEISKKIIISGTFKNAIEVLMTQGLNGAPKYTLTQTPEYKLNVGSN